MTFTTHPAVTALETKPAIVDRPGQHHAERAVPGRQPRYEVLLRIRVDDRIRKRNTGEKDAGVTSGRDADLSRNRPVQRLPDLPLPGRRQKQLRQNQRPGPDLRRAGRAETRDRKHRGGLGDADDRDRLDRGQPQPLADDLPLRVGGNPRLRDGDAVQRTDRRPRQRADRGHPGTHRPDPGDDLLLPRGGGQLQGDHRGRRGRASSRPTCRGSTRPRPSAVAKTSAHLGGLVAAVASPTTSASSTGPATAYGQSTPEVPIGEEPDLAPGGRRRRQSDARNHLPLPDRRDQRDRAPPTGPTRPSRPWRNRRARSRRRTATS